MFTLENIKKMKQISIKKISAAGVTAKEIPAVLKENKILYNKVENVNWPKEFPYCPKMEFGIAHTDDAFLNRVLELLPRKIMTMFGRIHAPNSSSVLPPTDFTTT